MGLVLMPMAPIGFSAEFMLIAGIKVTQNLIQSTNSKKDLHCRPQNIISVLG